MTPDPDLSDDLVAYYREVLITHGSVHGASICRICGVSRCADWVDAWDRLAAAGKQMSEPDHWGGPLPPSRRSRR